MAAARPTICPADYLQGIARRCVTRDDHIGAVGDGGVR
jgi:hypothetical protein